MIRRRLENIAARWLGVFFIEMEKNLLTRVEFGEAVFQAIKAEITSRGFSLWPPNFDPDYPISLRALHNIRKGSFKIETLKTLPGIRVEEWFCICK